MLCCLSIARTLFQRAECFSYSCGSDWVSCLTYLESTFSLRGYLGVDIFVNKTLNLHVIPTRLHGEFLCDELFDWAFGDDEDDLNKALLQASDEFESKIMPYATAPSLPLARSQAPSTTSATCHQPNPLYLPVPGPTSFTHGFALPKTPSWLYKN